MSGLVPSVWCTAQVWCTALNMLVWRLLLHKVSGFTARPGTSPLQTSRLLAARGCARSARVPQMWRDVDVLLLLISRSTG